MNKIAIAVIVVGVLLVISGAVLWKSSGDELEGLADNNRLYEGADSAMELEGWDKNDNYLVVVIEGQYANGRSSIPEGGSADLTTEDCNLVGDFTLKDSTGKNFFEPECMIEDDTTEDGLIHVGYICTTNLTQGCPDGTYTWNTSGTEIRVYDVTGVIEDLFGGLIGLVASFGAVCCGVIVLLVGIILAFTMQEDDPNQWAAVPGESSSTPEPGTNWDDKESGWSEKKDYIRNDEKDGE